MCFVDQDDGDEVTEKHTNTPSPKIHNPSPHERSNRIRRPNNAIIAAQHLIALLGTQLSLPGFLS